ncbi:helix-turn-helix transcriptional regulator [Streptomyces sp. LP05-1]|uniref:Helix-turn-helix transcriptional regulator n=1 Tax=Streptomyces pyxinae TaxID=2970734 RepID=A0ABT2CNP8_9ACTN|nr:helix-turn-helix domain-containing protein [Streptomyces sp. LP05-1]MCS0639063.1 helix-turn-helix transcriptional regulator [Streptomyces sp. LP05-1]
MARIEDCPLAAVVEHIGGWWTLELLHDAFDGWERFEDFRENLRLDSGVLAERLDVLVRNGIMERTGDAYALTALGRSLRPLLLTMAAWSNERLAPERRSLILVDARTGAEVEPVLVDRATGRRVDTSDHVFVPGPAAGEAMRARYAARPALSRQQDGRDGQGSRGSRDGQGGR